MNVLKPELVWIENRCYRNLYVKDNENKIYVEDDMYPAQPNEYTDEDEEEADCFNLPIKYENQKFWISVPVPGGLIGYVCGKQNNNVKRIQNTTGAQIKNPSRLNVSDGKNTYKRDISSDFVITADKKPSVLQAYKMLKSIMNSGRWRIADFTHFISIPLNSDAIQRNFLLFREDVTKLCPSTVKGAIFTNPSKLHLTIAMLTLLDERENEEAKAALSGCQSDILKILGGRQLSLDIKGIEYMNDDDTAVDVLYAEVSETEDSNVLQIIADKLAETYSSMDLSPPKHYSVKLHATLLKSKLNQEKRSSFDAGPILQKFKNYEFGKMTLTEIHISTRHTGHNKYYVPSAVIHV